MNSPANQLWNATWSCSRYVSRTNPFLLTRSFITADLQGELHHAQLVWNTLMRGIRHWIQFLRLYLPADILQPHFLWFVPPPKVFWKGSFTSGKSWSLSKHDYRPLELSKVAELKQVDTTIIQQNNCNHIPQSPSPGCRRVCLHSSQRPSNTRRDSFSTE
jgi:hypothetical protein